MMSRALPCRRRVNSAPHPSSALITAWRNPFAEKRPNFASAYDSIVPW